MNKPWRPLPSGRVTPAQARVFRWCLTIFCLGLSSLRGRVVLFSSAGLTLVEILHDDIGLSGNLLLKNLCNVGGYTTFELGASACFSLWSLFRISVFAHPNVEILQAHWTGHRSQPCYAAASSYSPPSRPK